MPNLTGNMDKVNLPTEKAIEPDEEARQPRNESIMPPPLEQDHSGNPKIAFSDSAETFNKSSSNKSSHKEVLSQPAPGSTHLQKLLWLQQHRAAGLWAQCDDCNRWRYLPNVLDNYELPKKWYCHMNPDSTIANCSIPEAPIRIHEEEDLIHSEYSAGSVVWARMPGWPWWPAMIDDCPDTEQFYWLDGFSDIPTHYNVVFFDSVEATRAWIAPEQLKPYAASRNIILEHPLKYKKYKRRLEAAVMQADDAINMSLVNRLQNYSFIARYKGNIASPKKINKKALERHQKKLMRKFNIQFPDTDSTDSEDESNDRRQTVPVKRKNVIMLETPKKTKAASSKQASRISKNLNGEDAVDKKVISSAVNIASKAENVTTEATSYNFKHPNSMAVQIGSTLDSAGSESFDNDTSKTYVPENATEETATESDFHVRNATPSSDDFDF